MLHHLVNELLYHHLILQRTSYHFSLCLHNFLQAHHVLSNLFHLMFFTEHSVKGWVLRCILLIPFVLIAWIIPLCSRTGRRTVNIVYQLSPYLLVWWGYFWLLFQLVTDLCGKSRHVAEILKKCDEHYSKEGGKTPGITPK